MSNYTYADLKMFLELLDEEQLKQTIQFAPEDEPVFSIYPSIMWEDMFDIKHDYDDRGYLGESKGKLLLPKGTVVFYQNFD